VHWDLGGSIYEYLQLGRLLDAQRPLTVGMTMLFIVVHQASSCG
jgi:tryptophan 2,3-dioxygenase